MSVFGIRNRRLVIDGLEPERFLIESNRQRVKTKAQRLREFKRLKEIEAKLADERKKENLKRGTERPVRPNLARRESAGKARDKAAATAGLKHSTAEKGLAVLNKADAGDAKAKELLESIASHWNSQQDVFRKIYTFSEGRAFSYMLSWMEF